MTPANENSFNRALAYMNANKDKIQSMTIIVYNGQEVMTTTICENAGADALIAMVCETLSNKMKETFTNNHFKKEILSDE